MAVMRQTVGKRGAPLRIGMAALTLVLFFVFVLVLAVQPSHAFPFSPRSGVVELNPHTFTRFISSHKPTVVLFYAPWCGHCQRFHPDYERFAKAVNGTIRVGAVNADTHTNLGAQFGIQGYPSVKFWRMGKKKSISDAEDYNYERTASALQSFLVSTIPDDRVKSRGVNDRAQLLQMIQNSPKKKVALLFSSKDKVPPVFSVLAHSPKLAELPFLFAGSDKRVLHESLGVAALPQVAVASVDATGDVHVARMPGSSFHYDALARFFLGELESTTSTTTSTTSTSTSTTSTSTTSTSTTASPPGTMKDGSRRAQTLSLTPTLEPGSLARYCSPTSSSSSSTSTLCIISLADKVEIEALSAQFRGEPVLFINAPGQHQQLDEELKQRYNFVLDDIYPPAAHQRHNDVVLFLRETRRGTLKYHVVSEVVETANVAEQLSLVLSGTTRLMSRSLGG